jgi:hypothetical protein
LEGRSNRKDAEWIKVIGMRNNSKKKGKSSKKFRSKKVFWIYFSGNFWTKCFPKKEFKKLR